MLCHLRSFNERDGRTSEATPRKIVIPLPTIGSSMTREMLPDAVTAVRIRALVVLAVSFGMTCARS